MWPHTELVVSPHACVTKDVVIASPASLGGVVADHLAPERVESLQSSKAPSPAVGEEGDEDEQTPTKRRRVS